ncbi:MAG: ABC transporter ATP-binding protein [Gemmatimonadota bacterium]
MGPPAPEPEVVRARGLSFRYRGSGKGLESLDLDVEAGEVLAVVGPNGSGKSTLLRLLATDRIAGDGSLTLFGLPAAPPSPQLRRRIAFAPDEGPHLSALTGRENLDLFRALRGRAAGPSHRRQDALLEAFSLGREADRPVAEYSFGMRRKLLLLEAIAGAPDLLLLDEPSIGLDAPGLGALQSEIRSRSGAGGTVVLATNELRELPFWADRVLLLDRGRRLVCDTPGALLQELQGRTRIRIALAPHPPEWRAPLERELRTVPHVHAVGGEAGFVEVQSTAGGAPLPALLSLVLDAGLEVRDVHLSEPGLADVFEALTGRRLEHDDGGTS